MNTGAFLSGDTIQVNFSVKNNTDNDIEKIPICLIESVMLWTKKSNIHINRVVSTAIYPNLVKKRSLSTGQVKMRVPALWPSSIGFSNLIEVSYYLVVINKTNGQNFAKKFEKPYEINSNSFDNESRLLLLIGTVSYKEDSIEPPPYTDLNETDQELPMYEEYQANNNRLLEVVVELDSRRLTLPAIVPDLSKHSRTFGSFFGSLFG